MSRPAIPAPYWIVGLALLAAALGYQMGLADREEAARPNVITQTEVN